MGTRDSACCCDGVGWLCFLVWWWLEKKLYLQWKLQSWKHRWLEFSRINQKYCFGPGNVYGQIVYIAHQGSKMGVFLPRVSWQHESRRARAFCEYRNHTRVEKAFLSSDAHRLHAHFCSASIDFCVSFVPPERDEMWLFSTWWSNNASQAYEFFIFSK